FPDRNRRAEGEQDREHGERQRAAERRQRRHDFERAGTHDDDRDERRRERKQREPPRPDGKPRRRLLSDAASRHQNWLSGLRRKSWLRLTGRFLLTGRF